MKKCCLLYACLLLFATINDSFSQSKSVDSLNSLLTLNTVQDTNRVKTLNKLSGELRGKDVAGSRSKAEEAFNLSQQLNYLPGKTYALRNIGISYLLQGEFIKANEFLQKGLVSAKLWGDPTITALILTNLGLVHSNISEYSKAISFLEEALSIVSRNKDSVNLSLVYSNLGQVYYFQANFPKALDFTLQSLKISEQLNDKLSTAQALTGVGNIYMEIGELDQALTYLNKALIANESLGSKRDISVVLNGIANIYRVKGDYANAIDYFQRAIKIKQEMGSAYGVALNESRLADIYLRQGNTMLALHYSYKSLAPIDAAGDKNNVGFVYGVIARAFLNKNNIDSAIYHGRKSLSISKETANSSGIVDASYVLAKAYAQKNDYSNAYEFQQLYTSYRDSVSSDSISRRVGLLLYNYNLEKKQSEITILTKDKEKQVLANKKQRDFLTVTLIGLGLFGIMAFALFRSNRQKQKVNKQLTMQKAEINSQAGLLLQQNKEINIQKDNLEKAFDDLKSTQSLLIQSVKMASLGELTAGIAHEIQNPLNFVNNFSEVNMDLIGEMKTEIDKGNLVEVKSIAEDIKANEEKINHHGKRADAIVKGMLQHSRSSTMVKEPTMINALVDEYVRLAYHGLRAKDKSFNTTINTSFDESIGTINIIPQDIGRVILNLINNSCYAVDEKKKRTNSDYDPTVSVSTIKEKEKVEIKVKDNGNGIPHKIIDKIFQPFFTTKPSGKGTGLGLSLSYDIVKAHGGEITVESKEGEGAEFIIKLPL